MHGIDIPQASEREQIPPPAVAKVERETRDAVAITFAVLGARRSPFASPPAST